MGRAAELTDKFIATYKRQPDATEHAAILKRAFAETYNRAPSASENAAIQKRAGLAVTANKPQPAPRPAPRPAAPAPAPLPSTPAGLFGAPPASPLTAHTQYVKAPKGFNPRTAKPLPQPKGDPREVQHNIPAAHNSIAGVVKRLGQGAKQFKDSMDQGGEWYTAQHIISNPASYRNLKPGGLAQQYDVMSDPAKQEAASGLGSLVALGGLGAASSLVPGIGTAMELGFGGQGLYNTGKRAITQGAQGFTDEPFPALMDLAMIAPGVAGARRVAGSLRGAPRPAAPAPGPLPTNYNDVAALHESIFGPRPAVDPIAAGKARHAEVFGPQPVIAPDPFATRAQHEAIFGPRPVEAPPAAPAPAPVVPKAQRIKAATPVEAAPAPAPVQTPEAPATAQVGAQGGNGEFARGFSDEVNGADLSPQRVSAHGDSEAYFSGRRAAQYGKRGDLPVHELTRDEFVARHSAKGPESASVAADVHRSSVEQAIEEGKPVPPEVLADYPDLKPAPSAAPAAPKEPWMMTRQEFQEWGARESKLPLDERSALIDGTHADMWAKTHATLVRKAVEQGLPVPKEVLESVGKPAPAAPPVDTTMSTPEPVQEAPAKPTPKAARIKAKKAAAAEAVAPEQPVEAPKAAKKPKTPKAPPKPREESPAEVRRQLDAIYRSLQEAESETHPGATVAARVVNRKVSNVNDYRVMDRNGKVMPGNPRMVSIEDLSAQEASAVRDFVSQYAERTETRFVRDLPNGERKVVSFNEPEQFDIHIPRAMVDSALKNFRGEGRSRSIEAHRAAAAELRDLKGVKFTPETKPAPKPAVTEGEFGDPIFDPDIKAHPLFQSVKLRVDKFRAEHGLSPFQHPVDYLDPNAVDLGWTRDQDFGLLDVQKRIASDTGFDIEGTYPPKAKRTVGESGALFSDEPAPAPKATPKRSRAGQRGHVIAGVPDIPGFKDWKPRWDAAKGKWLDPLGKEVPRDVMRLFAAYDRANPVAAQPESKKARVEALRRENGATLAKAAPKARPTLRPAEKPALTPEWPEPRVRRAEAPKAEAPARAAEAPKPKAPASTGEPVSLKKAAIADVRKRLDMEELPKPVRVSNQEVLDRAIARNLSDTAMETVKQAAREKRPLTPEEHAGAVLKMAELSKEVASADKTIRELEAAGNEAGARLEAARMRGFQDQMDELTANARKTGSAAGSGLQAIKIAVDPEEFTLARVLQKARETKGAPLTDTETRMHADQVKRLEELEAKIPELEAREAARNAQHEKELAEAVMRAESAKAGIRSKAAGVKARILTERKSILDELKSLGLQLNAGLDPHQLYVLGKLAVNHMKEGAANLDEVVRLVQAEVKGISKEDVYRALNQPDPAAVKKARSQTQANIAAAKTEARLLTQIDDALKGTLRAATATTPKTPPTPRIAELRKALADIRANLGKTGRDARSIEHAQAVIDDLEAQLAGHYRNLKKPKTAPPVEVEPLRARIKELRQTLRAEDTLAQLEHKLREVQKGNIPPPKPKVQLSPEMEKAQIDIADLRRDIRLSIEARRPFKAADIYRVPANASRGVMASTDISATFRQGLVLVSRKLFTDPAGLAKIQAKSLRAMFNKYTDAQIHNDIRNRPDYYLARKAKLALTEQGGEEMFRANFVEKIPGIGEVLKGSERHMRTFLNLLRMDAFERFVEANPNATSTELAMRAESINVFSGRGNLGVFEPAATVLADFGFSPRYKLSRFQTPYQIVKAWKEPRVRAEIVKDYGATVAFGVSLLTLAKLSGFKVGTSVDDPDWGKVVIPHPGGDLHVDVWGGYQQAARLIFASGLWVARQTGVTGRDMPAVDKKFDPLDAAFNTAKSGASPGVSLAYELLSGKNVIGQKVTPKQAIIGHITPISAQDTYDAYKAGGPKAALTAGTLSAIGMGVNTYSDNETKTRKKIRQALDKGDYETARRIAREWNKANPKAAIRSQKTTAELLKAERERRNEDK